MKGSLAETTYLIQGKAEVVKWFTSPTKVLIANILWLLASMLYGHPQYVAITPQSLLQGEVSGREFTSRLGMEVPRITGVGDSYLIQEYVQAYNGIDYCRGFPAEKRRILREYASRLLRLHRAGMAKGDTRIQNLLVMKDGRLIDLDYEMSGRVDSFRQCLDIYVFLHSMSADTESHQRPFFDSYGSRPREPWPLWLALRMGMPLFNIYYDVKASLHS